MENEKNLELKKLNWRTKSMELENRKLKEQLDKVQKELHDLKLERQKNVGGSGSEAELREQLEKVQKENMNLKLENQELKKPRHQDHDQRLIAENSRLRAQLEVSGWKVPMTYENYEIWLESRKQEITIETEDPVGIAKRKLARILEKSTDQHVKDSAKEEFDSYHRKFRSYQEQLERRTRMLRINPMLKFRIADLPEFDVPRLPCLSAEFEYAYDTVKE